MCLYPLFMTHLPEPSSLSWYLPLGRGDFEFCRCHAFCHSASPIYDLNSSASRKRVFIMLLFPQTGFPSSNPFAFFTVLPTWQCNVSYFLKSSSLRYILIILNVTIFRGTDQ